MRVSMGFDLGIKPDKVEYTAEFTWETGDLAPPRCGDRIWLGELIAIVAEVRYTCADAKSLAASAQETPAVVVDLWLRLSKATRKSRYAPGEFHTILSGLPSVTELYVTGSEQ